MTSFCRSWIWGPLLDGSDDRLVEGFGVRATLCALGAGLIAKGRVRTYRSISRNGRILFASDVPPGALAGKDAALSFRYWRRRLLPGDPLSPYGVLVCAWTGRPEGRRAGVGERYAASLADAPAAGGSLFLDLGGRRVLTLHATSRR
jgi:hypothetical protein